MFTSERVRLRPLEAGDLERARSWVNDWTTCRGVNRVLPVTAEEQAEWFRRLADDPARVVFGVDARHEDGTTWEHVGTAGLNGIDPRSRSAELWMIIGPTARRGRGLGTEATRLLVWYGLQCLNLHRISLYTPATNDRALSVYRRIGFVEEGRARQAVFFEGRYLDTIHMGLLEGEFDPAFHPVEWPAS